MIKRLITYSIFLSTVFFIFSPHVLFAANLEFAKSALTVGVGEKFAVPFRLVTDGVAINALEGSLTFDPTFLTPSAVLDGSSIISAWIKNIDLHDGGALRGSLLLSGIIPKGLTEGGDIVTIIFTAKKSGETHIVGTGIAYKNDGKATPVILSPIELPISSKEGTSSPLSGIIPQDSTKPTVTRFEIAQNEAVFDGAYFIVFSASDNVSGIDHFEVLESAKKLVQGKESEATGWKPVKSPAPLADQTLQSFVYLKAVDRAGNSTIQEVVTQSDLSPRKVNSRFSYTLTLGILILTVFGVLFFFYHRRQGMRHDSYHQ